MKSNIIKINKMNKNNFSGNFLYKDEKNYYFDKNLTNCIFLKDKSLKNQQVPCISFYQHINEHIEICENSKNKPSILYVGNSFQNEKFSKIESIENINFNDDSLFLILNQGENFENLFKSIIESRTTDIFSIYKPLFIFIDDFSNINAERLLTFVTISRSRQIYINLCITDENVFDDYIFEMIYHNCPIKFIYNENSITNILNRFDDAFDKQKCEFIEYKQI